ncbi:hypothetical protein PCL_10801 [Purpureocillium lilacinum]|uniref:Uncharacterized protein n=1 Tax=Purpureocillium lilacinum TaxID=33203 RepID=A0A2U3ECF2_PURLI|nr:hypothetical protein PCL_10801 [Purpureocillium lilacinum]
MGSAQCFGGTGNGFDSPTSHFQLEVRKRIASQRVASYSNAPNHFYCTRRLQGHARASVAASRRLRDGITRTTSLEYGHGCNPGPGHGAVPWFGPVSRQRQRESNNLETGSRSQGHARHQLMRHSPKRKSRKDWTIEIVPEDGSSAAVLSTTLKGSNTDESDAYTMVSSGASPVPGGGPLEPQRQSPQEIRADGGYTRPLRRPPRTPGRHPRGPPANQPHRRPASSAFERTHPQPTSPSGLPVNAPAQASPPAHPRNPEGWALSFCPAIVVVVVAIFPQPSTKKNRRPSEIFATHHADETGKKKREWREQTGTDPLLLCLAVSLSLTPLPLLHSSVTKSTLEPSHVFDRLTASHVLHTTGSSNPALPAFQSPSSYRRGTPITPRSLAVSLSTHVRSLPSVFVDDDIRTAFQSSAFLGPDGDPTDPRGDLHRPVLSAENSPQTGPAEPGNQTDARRFARGKGEPNCTKRNAPAARQFHDNLH